MHSLQFFCYNDVVTVKAARRAESQPFSTGIPRRLASGGSSPQPLAHAQDTFGSPVAILTELALRPTSGLARQLLLISGSEIPPAHSLESHAPARLFIPTAPEAQNRLFQRVLGPCRISYRRDLPQAKSSGFWPLLLCFVFELYKPSGTVRPFFCCAVSRTPCGCALPGTGNRSTLPHRPCRQLSRPS